jgi:hypothetical protein
MITQLYVSGLGEWSVGLEDRRRHLECLFRQTSEAGGSGVKLRPVNIDVASATGPILTLADSVPQGCRKKARLRCCGAWQWNATIACIPRLASSLSRDSVKSALTGPNHCDPGLIMLAVSCVTLLARHFPASLPFHVDLRLRHLPVRRDPWLAHLAMILGHGVALLTRRLHWD